MIHHQWVQKLVEAKVLIKPEKCEICKKSKILIAHHPDYFHPSEIKWICKSYHGYIHKNSIPAHRKLFIIKKHQKEYKIPRNIELNFSGYFK
jgi:hypothetical protein